ncbi:MULTISPECIES: ATP-binding protein [unclassified Enterococcus]|uniref:sensor histidine kinase n=1 Tax=unclassified Enterococcus TaxID=2608891 RepID=UPI001556601F|nr:MULTISPECIES: ATP-binding protein [unclassified Enterococcus]MBS7576661.1 hypothetical protein [Enterococcus sp. MMGLQ5-2]MBS7583852.1 hypothetical protein [Enterococcus sp. MMGLQ5-1]NPD11713.1 hypothetical protein [Enterococcus sp. MMGLQ5-1]NPD36498.1 hypothetical protein [Enterococcus sp. MMGLQ5-2]
MKKQIFKQSLSLTLITLLITISAISLILFSQLQKRFFTELAEETSVVKELYLRNGLDGLKSIKVTDRITLIDSNGTVLYDNRAKISQMDNHNHRPEVQAARLEGIGQSRRESDTLLSKNFYYATLIDDNTVLRLSTTETSFLNYYLKLITPAIIILLLVSLLSYLLSKRLSKRIIQPIDAVDLIQPEKSQVYPELQPFLNRLITQNKKIHQQLEDLSQKERELALITTHMKEGLIVLDGRDRLLMANPIAKAIFRIKSDDFNDYFIKIERSQLFIDAVENIHQNNSQEIQFKTKHHTYQALLNPVFQKNNFIGTVMFIFDITDSASQEEMRREFTSNVTHELKTPLTSISGYAEIIHAGIVQPEDCTRFAGKIYDEAQRLLALVNDTLKLSGIENNDLLDQEIVPWEKIVSQINNSMHLTLAKKHQELAIEIEPVHFYGYPSVIQDILYNLIENASKYSGQGGQISLSIYRMTNDLVIKVKDDGPGIDKREQERIFERFYRADKSHSSQISGTGLGLSIVKHGVLLHHGKIEIDSILGEGACFIVTLPINESPKKPKRH